MQVLKILKKFKYGDGDGLLQALEILEKLNFVDCDGYGVLQFLEILGDTFIVIVIVMACCKFLRSLPSICRVIVKVVVRGQDRITACLPMSRQLDDLTIF